MSNSQDSQLRAGALKNRNEFLDEAIEITIPEVLEAVGSGSRGHNNPVVAGIVACCETVQKLAGGFDDARSDVKIWSELIAEFGRFRAILDDNDQRIRSGDKDVPVLSDTSDLYPMVRHLLGVLNIVENSHIDYERLAGLNDPGSTPRPAPESMPRGSV